MIKVGLCQIEGTSNLYANLKKAREFFQKATQSGIDLLVFPEMFMALPEKDVSPADVAPKAHEFLANMANLSKEYGIGCIFGFWEPSEDPKRPFNSAAMIRPDGFEVARYRKLHLFDALNVSESSVSSAGQAPPPVVKIKDISTGLAICYDLRFSQIFDHLTSQEADLVIVISAWYEGIGKEDHWLTLLKARAIEYTCYVAGCNMVGYKFCGRSAAFDPFGMSLGDAGEEEGLLEVTVKKERVAAVRKKLPVLQHQRTDLFPKGLRGF